MDPAIAIDALTKVYRRAWSRSPAVRAVDGLSLRVERGSVLALVGPNGAGKTTTIFALIGLVTPDSGAVTVLGKSPGDLAARRLIGFQSEIFHPYRFLTVRTALRFYGRLSGLDARSTDERSRQLAERLGLGSAFDRRVGTFSKGMTQRLGLAQALLHQPELLIMDEPTTGLDPQGRRLVADLILEQKARGTAVLLQRIW
jgi:ABC-2 type transport system ATP-binding protein